MNASLADLKNAARRRIQAAAALLSDGVRYPQEACYLTHVSLECAFKAAVLEMHGKTRIADLAQTMPDALYSKLFFGTTGHDLEFLSKTACLDRKAAAAKQVSPRKDPTWPAIVASPRPYSLRYGSERVASRNASAEIALAKSVIRLLGVMA